MSETSVRTWEEANQICLMAALSEIRAQLVKLLSPSEGQKASDLEAQRTMAEIVRGSMSAPPALDTLCATFDLTSFERKILLMCAGVELDSRFAAVYAAVNKDHRPSLPTFSLALSAFSDAHWSALLPARPLRYWRLMEFSPGDALTTSPLRIDERILHYLAGVPSIDERLREMTQPLSVSGELPASQRALAEQVAGRWSRSDGQTPWPVIQLWGSDLASRRGVAEAACARLGLRLRVMSAQFAPRGLADLNLFIRLWEREAALGPCCLLLEDDDTESLDNLGETSLKHLLETIHSPVQMSTRERHKLVQRQILSFDVSEPTSAEQLKMWKETLGASALVLDGKVEALVSQFTLNASDVQAVVAQAIPLSAGKQQLTSSSDTVGLPLAWLDTDSQLAAALWESCRTQTRPRLEGLAQRVESSATWDDLVLPEKQKQLLLQIALHVRQRSKVYESWGFASHGSRGLGISALFAGPSGTGKTMAGEVLANELRLDLYRIDLSQVVSKYIGETEKNLRRVFDAAEGGAAILLFDEADALFGKRSEVKDSHDRYANIEVSYLLQRMEAYRGLAILTTNRKDALDAAFLRRIRFVVEFPFPDVAQRAEIWRRIFPPQTPTEGLHIDRLARLNAAGGNIRNIALGAAFFAADAGEPVRMPHLLQAARSEFAKLEKPLTSSEIAGWI